MSQGWIKLHRQLMDDHYWLSEPFTRGQAWVDILLQTNHAPGFFRTANGRRVDVIRGQCGMSQLTMSKRWQWSRGRVKRFLNELEKDGNVIQQTVQQNSLLSVCNYNKYQGPDSLDGTTDSTANDTTDGQLTDSKRDTNKNVKNGNNEKNGKKEYSDLFIEFWSVYPKGRKSDKPGCFAKFKKQPHQTQLDIIEHVRIRATCDAQWLEGYIPLSKTFMNNNRWTDEYRVSDGISNFDDKTQKTVSAMQEFVNG